MTGNESMPSGDSPRDGTACGTSVHDPSVLNKSVPWPSVQGRLEWIDERVEIARELVNGQGWQASPEIEWVLGTVEEFADLLRIHFAGVES